MTVRSMIPILMAAALGLLAITIAAGRERSARSSAELAGRELALAVHEAEEILALRLAEQRIEVGEKPEQQLIAQVNAALARAGIPRARFQGLSNEANRVVSDQSLGRGPIHRRQSHRLSMTALGPADLGRFLRGWEEAHPMWTVSRVELNHHRGRRGENDNLYDVTVVIGATYVGEP